jgi:hypothetical protein
MKNLIFIVFAMALFVSLSQNLSAQTLDRNYYSNQARTMYACNPKADKSNVREGPSSRDYKVVSELLNGQHVDVLDRVQNSGGYDYYKIVYHTALSNGRLYENIGYVYHAALANTCEANFKDVVARNQQWPISNRWWGCNFIFQDAKVDKQWSRVAREMRAQSMSQAAKTICQQASDYKISVKKYLGFKQDDQREYFHVIMNGCDAEFSIGDVGNGAEFAYGWAYDQSCLDRKNKPQVQASSGHSKSGGFFSTWFNNMFGGSSGSFDASGFSATYTLVCRDRVLFDLDTWKRGASQSCTGEIYQCEDKFKASLETTYGGLSKACAAQFGSKYTFESIDYDY